jgi:hypothetical protein
MADSTQRNELAQANVPFIAFSSGVFAHIVSASA